VNKTTHQNLILDQFTRQAAPFSAAAMIKDEAVLRLIVEAASLRPDDTVLDVACGPGPMGSVDSLRLWSDVIELII